jgi:hypothetical protein
VLPGPRQRQRLRHERRPRRPQRIERIVLAAKPTLATHAPSRFDHRLARGRQIASEAGAVVAGTLDRPNTHAMRIPLADADRLAIPLHLCRDRVLRDERTCCRDYDREHMFVAVRVDTDHVVHLLCKHPDRSSVHRRVRNAGLEQGNRAAGL